MNTNNIILKMLITCCFFFLLNPAFAQSYWEVEGVGANKSEATRNAKEELSKRIYSKIELSEEYRDYCRKSIRDIGGVTEIDEECTDVDIIESRISTLPISIRNMEEVTSRCDELGCTYLFRVNVGAWVDYLSIDIDKQHQLAQQYLSSQGSNWKDVVFTHKARTLLKSNKQSLLVLSSLDHDVAKTLNEPQLVLERNVIKRIQNFSVSIRSASDMYSSQTKSILARNVATTSEGDIIVYIKGNVRHGKKNNIYKAKQDLILQVFEAKSPNVVVSQNILSEIGESPISKELALDDAHKKITATLNENSIYTLLN
ncbi:hypothetical protein AB4589_08050 [Vibrio sp. 10N.222.49.A3]|uniref:hypothetical protein n=1 Tax=Vibrio sp. 10N.222.49.A3 TaxID=3229611 RepID=UPI00354C6ADE